MAEVTGVGANAAPAQAAQSEAEEAKVFEAIVMGATVQFIGIWNQYKADTEEMLNSNR